MRSLLLFFSLFILLQPASGAMNVTSSTMSKSHCQNALQAEAQSMRIPAGDHDMSQGVSAMADCQTACHGGCTSAASLPLLIGLSFAQQTLSVAYNKPLLSFYSRTESPEPRPPLT